MVQCTKNTLEVNGFTQLITGVTRCWPGQLDSAIDHLWSNDHTRVMSCSNEVEAVGDHSWIAGHIRLTGSDSKMLDTRRRNLRNFDPVKYREKLAEINWAEIYEIPDVDLANNFLERKLSPILNEMCPLTTVQHRSNYKPWISNETSDTMKERDRVREVARSSHDPASWQLYKSLRNKANSMVDKDRKHYYSEKYKKLHDTKDVSGTYKMAKVQAGWKATATPVTFNVQGKKITAPQEMADIQLDTFKKKTEKLLSQLPPPTQDPLSSLEEAMSKWEGRNERSQLKFKIMSRLEILEIINRLGYSNSAAHDKLYLQLKLQVNLMLELGCTEYRE